MHSCIPSTGCSGTPWYVRESRFFSGLLRRYAPRKDERRVIAIESKGDFIPTQTLPPTGVGENSVHPRVTAVLQLPFAGVGHMNARGSHECVTYVVGAPYRRRECIHAFRAWFGPVHRGMRGNCGQQDAAPTRFLCFVGVARGEPCNGEFSTVENSEPCNGASASARGGFSPCNGAKTKEVAPSLRGRRPKQSSGRILKIRYC